MKTKSLMNQFRWMWEHWKPYRVLIPVLLILSLANAATAVSYPYLIKWIIDGITGSASMAYLMQCVATILVLGVVQFFIYTNMQYLRAKMNLRFDFSVRIRAFEHILRMGPSFFSKFRTGDVVTRLIDDVGNKLAWYMCSGIFRVIEASALILFCVVAMYSISPKLTLYAAGPLPLLIGMFVLTADKLLKRYKRVQETISRLNDSLESCFSGVRVVKAFAAEEAQRDVVFDAVERQRTAEIQAVRWQTVIDSLYGNIWQLAIVGVLLAGGAMAMEGNVSLGDIVAFDSYVLFLVWPMFDVGQFFVRGRLSAVSISRISELEQFPPDVSSPEEEPIQSRRPLANAPLDVELKPSSRAEMPIRFEQVGYRFTEGEKNVLHDVNFDASAGRLIALVGAIGSGKSTAISLIPRLMDPTYGTISIADLKIQEWSLVELRQSIGYVPQDVNLLSGTVRENILFGRSWVVDDDVARAISISHLTEDAEKWPDGLDTLVGSRGIRLSGGQKQRVALARALAGNPSLLLLDDCTASLDAETEDEVWRELHQSLPHCTTILVTHRPATLEKADHIVVLDKGEVVESGSFSALNSEGTLFHELYVRWKKESDLTEP